MGDRELLRKLFPHSFDDIEAKERYDELRSKVVKDFYGKGRLVMFQAPWQGRTWVNRALERFDRRSTDD